MERARRSRGRSPRGHGEHSPVSKVPQPAATVMIYEGEHGKLNFRHDGKATVGFVDGHVKLVDAEAAKPLRWKP